MYCSAVWYYSPSCLLMTSSSLYTEKKPAFPNPLYHWQDTIVPIQSVRSWNPFPLLLSLYIIQSIEPVINSTHITTSQHLSSVTSTKFQGLFCESLSIAGGILSGVTIFNSQHWIKEFHLWLIVASYSQSSPLAFRANQPSLILIKLVSVRQKR